MFRYGGPPEDVDALSGDHLNKLSWNQIPQQHGSRSTEYFHEMPNYNRPPRDSDGRLAGYSETVPKYQEDRSSRYQDDGWGEYKDEAQEQFLENRSQLYLESRSSFAERIPNRPSLPEKMPKSILRNKMANSPEVSSGRYGSASNENASFRGNANFTNPNPLERNQSGDFGRSFREDLHDKRRRLEIHEDPYLRTLDSGVHLHDSVGCQGFDQQRKTGQSLPYALGQEQMGSLGDRDPHNSRPFSYRESDDIQRFSKGMSDSRFHESSFADGQHVTGSLNTSQKHTKPGNPVESDTQSNSSRYSRDRYREEEIHSSVYDRENLRRTQLDSMEHRQPQSRALSLDTGNVSASVGLTEGDRLRRIEERGFYTRQDEFEGRMESSNVAQRDEREYHITNDRYKSVGGMQGNIDMLGLTGTDRLPTTGERNIRIKQDDYEGRMKCLTASLASSDEREKYLIGDRYKGDRFDITERSRLQKFEEEQFSGRPGQFEERLKSSSPGSVSRDERGKYLIDDMYKDVYSDQADLIERERIQRLEERHFSAQQDRFADRTKPSSPAFISRDERSVVSIDDRSKQFNEDSSVVDIEKIVTSASFLQPVESLEARIQKFEKELKKHSLVTRERSRSPTCHSPDRLLGKLRRASVEREDVEERHRRRAFVDDIHVSTRSHERNSRQREDRDDPDSRRRARETNSPQDTSQHRHTDVDNSRSLSRKELHRGRLLIDTMVNRNEKDKSRRNSRSERSRSPVSIRSSRFDQRRERNLHERSPLDVDRRNREVERTRERSFEREEKHTSTRRHSPSASSMHGVDRGYGEKTDVKHREHLPWPSEFNQKSVEDIVNKACSGSVNLSSIGKAYRLPVNCFQLQPPKIQTDALIQVPELARNEDNLLRDAQLFLAIGMVPVINLASLFITNLFSVDKATVYAVDSLVLLGQTFHEFMSCREALLTSAVSSDNMYESCGSGGIKSRFDKAFPKGKVSGKPVDIYIANMVNLACSKWGEIESIQSKYMTNSNCKNVLFPKINVLKKRFITEHKEQCDAKLQGVIKCLALGMAPLIECTLLMHSKFVDIQTVSALITDSLMLLGHTMYKLSLLRCRLLRSNLPTAFNQQKRKVFTNELFDEAAPDDGESALDNLEKKEHEDAKLEDDHAKVFKIQEHRVQMMCQMTGMKMSDLDNMCEPVFKVNTAFVRLQAKNWIALKGVDQSHCDLIMLYVLMKIFDKSVPFEKRVRLVHLLHEVLVHCRHLLSASTAKGQALRNSLDRVIVPAISYALTKIENHGEKKIIIALIGKWEASKSFPDHTIEKMKEPESSWKEYQDKLIKHYGSMLEGSSNTAADLALTSGQSLPIQTPMSYQMPPDCNLPAGSVVPPTNFGAVSTYGTSPFPVPTSEYSVPSSGFPVATSGYAVPPPNYGVPPSGYVNSCPGSPYGMPVNGPPFQLQGPSMGPSVIPPGPPMGPGYMGQTMAPPGYMGPPMAPPGMLGPPGPQAVYGSTYPPGPWMGPPPSTVPQMQPQQSFGNQYGGNNSSKSEGQIPSSGMSGSTDKSSNSAGSKQNQFRHSSNIIKIKTVNKNTQAARIKKKKTTLLCKIRINLMISLTQWTLSLRHGNRMSAVHRRIF
ncbi:uncharacterized protein LOC121375913 isoform X2 [Gigantopelta aegis]|uniref:uncharacterized protein LOC121375913 isoform X2 n=1 Tax=Gigantopelta aegis TaxID=1735272 RepID=UPI001B88D680|nr:uncharacterized protein LOC121375913 isoform X2 [Gigantopelta aegis]